MDIIMCMVLAFCFVGLFLFLQWCESQIFANKS